MPKCSLLVLTLLALVSVVFAVPRELVVVEVGTGTWCGYCPGAAMGCHDLLENGHAVAVIKNHNGDPYANTYSNARNSYYAISGYPTANFDGQNPYVGGSGTASMYNNYLPRVNARLAIPSKYTIATTGTNDGLNYSLAVTVSKPEADTNTNVVLHAVITETDIPQNWFNQTHVDNVNRLMVPNQSGTPINLGTGESTTVNLNFATQASWNAAKLELVVFLQNTSSKEILQGKKYSLAGLAGALPVSTTSLSFPETYVTGSATLPFTITNFFDSQVTGTISSNNPVFTIANPNFTLNGGQNLMVEVGFNPTAAQNYSGVLTINSNLQNHPSIQINMTGTGFLNTAPVAEDVVITGPPVIYQNLYGEYTFVDADGNTELASQMQWYRMVGGNPVEIPGATNDFYKLVASDEGQVIVFGVTPVDQHGMAGAVAYSTPTATIEPLPAPRNFNAVVSAPQTVTCTWERPLHFEGRGFVGYRVYRSGLLVNTITNPNNTTFTDTYLMDGTYVYHAVSLFNDPMVVSEPSNSVTIEIGPTSNEEDVVPVVEGISASPNPFHTQTTLSIRGKAGQAVKVQIFNTRGQIVRTMNSSIGSAGELNLDWNGIDENGRRVQSGIYLYRLTGLDKTHSGRIVLSR
ncbi:MAG: Omp28-related outer membrane protein [Candidatus Cloacimonadota bacterium]